MDTRNITTRKITILKGTVGDLVTEYMTGKETKKFWKDHTKHIAELKAKGEYLQPVEIEVSIANNPLLDASNGAASESHRMEIFNIGDLSRTS